MAVPPDSAPDPEVRRVVDAAREIWIRRLIDHSRANSLLFYRGLKVGAIELTGAPAAVRRLLVGETLAAEALAAGAAATDGAAAEATQDVRQKVRHALLAIQRKALGNLEEKGIDTLHLALGMATWPAADGGRPYDAPVLLLPARIAARGRAGDDLGLTVAGEPQLNPVLMSVLEDGVGVRVDADALLAECGGEDESGRWVIDPEGVFDRLQREAAAVPGFEVSRRVVLANFQFAKMAMVEDLKRNGDAMAGSAIVAAIAGHNPSRQALARAVAEVEPAALDERPATADYLVLDADSTQQRAIALIGHGQNGVVQGPPGTGKSQTISNLIAQAVAEGRRILFVAEKRAALDAVIKRLSHPGVGLGHLVLDLHGASVSRKEVMARLAQALDQIRHAPPAVGAEAVHREFEARRRQLNEHARRVNAAREPTGLSVNGMIGRLLWLPAAAWTAPDASAAPRLAVPPHLVDRLVPRPRAGGGARGGGLPGRRAPGRQRRHRAASPPPPAPRPEPGPPAPAPPPAGRGPRPLIAVRASIDEYSDRELRQIAEWATSDGLLRTDEELVRQMFEALPFQRMGGRIRARLLEIAQAMRSARPRDILA